MIDERNRLLRVPNRDSETKEELHKLNEKLDALGLAYQSLDPDFENYLRALHSVRRSKERTYTPREIAEQDEFIRDFIERLQ